ncbi:hypothetical protein [Stutzerimonas zhaodongensis]|uniref:hypothetical protein n=1 Tax=Stutzerimonas TaxID=2901164 RepID=UPI00388FDABF
MCKFALLRTSGAIFVAVVALMVGGCSIQGTYTDSTEPDAAKLRFISDLSSATLGVFDEKHCDGRTTGILNNLFVPNSGRRVGMAVEPPASADAYLEISIPAGRELYLHLNSQDTSTVCGNGFNLTPRSGSEYEITFNGDGNRCRVSLASLNQVDGQVARLPVPVVYRGLAGCDGSNGLFPKRTKPQPETPQRTAMIDKIIESSMIEEMQPKPESVAEADRLALREKTIEERKQQMQYSLPAAYWEEYRSQVAKFAADVDNLKSDALQRYKNEYRHRLGQLDTDELRKLVPDTNATDLSLSLLQNNAMLNYYHGLEKQILKESLSSHFSRMADLDRRYDVCKRFVNCWKD